MHVTMTK